MCVFKSEKFDFSLSIRRSTIQRLKQYPSWHRGLTPPTENPSCHEVISPRILLSIWVIINRWINRIATKVSDKKLESEHVIIGCQIEFCGLKASSHACYLHTSLFLGGGGDFFNGVRINLLSSYLQLGWNWSVKSAYPEILNYQTQIFSPCDW